LLKNSFGSSSKFIETGCAAQTLQKQYLKLNV